MSIDTLVFSEWKNEGKKRKSEQSGKRKPRVEKWESGKAGKRESRESGSTYVVVTKIAFDVIDNIWMDA